MYLQASSNLTKLYYLLAESLSEPDEWLSDCGTEWELYSIADDLTQEIVYPSLAEAVEAIAAVPAETSTDRLKRYQDLLAGKTQPLPIYESLMQEGRLHGMTTFQIWGLYRTVGLNVVGSELPDHVSIELVFLSHMVQQELEDSSNRLQWRKARREFIKQHAAKWMPQLGAIIANTQDPVYRPIGLLLRAIIQAETLPTLRQRPKPSRNAPSILRDDDCTLCGFCAQVCPTHALAITETPDITVLQIVDSQCVSCSRCVHICPEDNLQLVDHFVNNETRPLFQSTRAKCAGCGMPTVSDAEIEAIAKRIGHPKWLDYCSDCRIVFAKDI